MPMPSIKTPDANWESVDHTMAAAMAGGAFPGAVLLAGQGGDILYHRAFGAADIFTGEAMTRGTVFDLASLTKPLGTTLAAMHLADSGALDLDRPVSALPSRVLASSNFGFTTRMLLNHTSGLPAWRPYFQVLCKEKITGRKAKLRELLLNEALVCPSGEKTLYSDVGFMWLSLIVEELSGTSVETALEKTVYPSMAAKGIYFSGRTHADDTAIAAGQLCPWRHKLLKGEVDDENAYCLGGVAGHAGLFGTAMAVHKVIAALWAVFTGAAANDLFSTDTARLFMTPPPDGGRPLGFDIPTGENRHAVVYSPAPPSGTSDSPVCHSGWT
jgi:CubicO group peptidase (beta-lactamase class C family)